MRFTRIFFVKVFIAITLLFCYVSKDKIWFTTLRIERIEWTSYGLHM